MPIRVEILTYLRERDAKRDADRLSSIFDDAGDRAGRRFGDRFGSGLRRSNVRGAFDDIALHAMYAADGLHNFEDNAKSTIRTLNMMGKSTAYAARGLGMMSLPILGLITMDLAKVVGESTKSLWLLPAAATAGAAAIGTLALATSGFGDAIKDIRDPEKFATDLASLSPAAQQAALSIQHLLPQFDALKNATQDSFFSGLGEEIRQLANTYLPTIQQMTTSIAGSFNQMLKDIGGQLMSPDTKAQITNITTNIAAAFQNATPAVKAFTQAFIDIADVGSDFLPGIGTSIAVVAQQFADFIRNAKETGQLRTWIQEGIDAVKSLAGATWELIQAGKDLYNLFTNESGVNDFKDDMEGLHTITATLSGDFHVLGDDIRREFESLQGPSRAFVNIWLDIPEALATALNKAIDIVNGFIHRVNSAMQGSVLGKIFDLIPGGPSSQSLNIPDIGHVPTGGDWGGLAGPPIMGGPGQPTVANPRGQPNRTSRPGHGPDPALFSGGPQYPVPPPPPPKGSTPSDRERRDAIAAGIDPSLYRIDPFAGMPGGMPAQATTGGATGSSQYGGTGPVGMKYNAFGQPQGYGAYQTDPQQILEAQHKVESDAHDLEMAKRDRLVLERDNQATAREIEDAKWKEQEAGWKLQASQADLAKAMQGDWQKMQDASNDLTKGLDDIGASLDKDFGISKGLPGIAENLTKFIANIATADALGRLNAQVAADPHKGGYGLMGILGAQGAFGPMFTGLDDSQSTTGGSTGASQYGPSSSTYSPAGSGPVGAPAPGEDARSFAHRVMMPFWESQGLTVGDHAADQYGEHQHGALDIMVPDLATGNNVLQQVLSDPNVYGAIFNRQSYGYGHGATPQAYTGDNPHTDHVHAWYKPGDPSNITPGGPGVSTGGGYQQMGSTPFGSIPIPLPVTIVGGGGGGGPMAMAGGGAGLSLGNAGAPGGLSAEQWTNIMGAEAGGSGGWAANTGNGYYGGLQFTQGSWDAAKPAGAPLRADLATAEQQMAAGNKLLQMQGPGAWPATSAAHPEWFATTGGPTALPTSGFAGEGMPFGLSPAPGIGGPMVGGAAGSGLLSSPMAGSAAGQGLGPSRIGGVAPSAPNPGGGGIGITPGGTIDTAANLAAMAFPGVGQAAATGMKLANRAIEYAGQVAGIGVSGLMETFLPTGGSELANNNWLTRIAGAIGGAAPALPNIAGGAAGKAQMEGQPAINPNDVSGGQGTGAPPGPTINLQYNNNRATEDRAGADITNHLRTQYTPPGRQYGG